MGLSTRSKFSMCRIYMEYIGYLVTWYRIRPINKKVEAIVNMTPPNTTKQLHVFIGLVNHYKDMWHTRSHLQHPLSVLTSNKVKFKWTGVEQKSFDDIKHAVANKNLLEYTDLKKMFDINTDASYYQLGAVIIQGGKLIAFYSRKHTGTHTRYKIT